MARCISYSVVGSTQEVALRLAREGAPHGTAVRAGSQMLGRGRQGASWASPKGGLYLSMVVRPSLEAFPLLSLAVGLELRNLLAPRAPKGLLMIKWPNDLLAVPATAGGGVARKIGGVLTDVVTRPGIDTYGVVGIGLNVEARRSDFPPELQGRIAFLADLWEGPVQEADLERPVRAGVLQACAQMGDAKGREALVASLTPHLYGIGKEVTVEGTKGTFVGVAPQGQALVEVPGERQPRRFEAGELQIEVP